MSSTEIGYAATGVCAMFSTEIGYAATRRTGYGAETLSSGSHLVTSVNIPKIGLSELEFGLVWAKSARFQAKSNHVGCLGA
eukprot:173402-Rhodomonas_salina.2